MERGKKLATNTNIIIIFNILHLITLHHIKLSIYDALQNVVCCKICVTSVVCTVIISRQKVFEYFET